MRISPFLVLFSAAAACARHPAPATAPLPAPPPPPEAPPPPPPPPVVIVNGGMGICVLRNGRLEDVYVEYNPARGDTTYQGRPFSAAFSADSTYALNAGWFRHNEPISFARGRYVKYGLPRMLGTTDVVPIGTYQGVTVFVEAGVNRERPEVLYIPVRPGCEFQPYTPFAKM